MKKLEITNKKRSYTLVEIAEVYNVDVRTLYNWILPIRQELIEMYSFPKKRLTILLPKQVKRIEEHLG